MKESQRQRANATSGSRIDLENFEAFRDHPWLSPVLVQYRKHDCLIAERARDQLLTDLKDINEQYLKENERVLFTNYEGRVKTEESLLGKLHGLCCRSTGQALTQDTIREIYDGIRDIGGVRIAFAYYDEVESAISDVIRPYLNIRGYATNIADRPGCADRNYLDDGDDHGYRSYHFFVEVPTLVDIFGDAKPFVCEVQARTELQHVWASKSHDLIYKNESGDVDKDLVEMMKNLSRSLRAADGYFVDIRKRVESGRKNDSKEER